MGWLEPAPGCVRPACGQSWQEGIPEISTFEHLHLVRTKSHVPQDKHHGVAAVASSPSTPCPLLSMLTFSLAVQQISLLVFAKWHVPYEGLHAFDAM